jgi:hypothetical protein
MFENLVFDTLTPIPNTNIFACDVDISDTNILNIFPLSIPHKLDVYFDSLISCCIFYINNELTNCSLILEVENDEPNTESTYKADLTETQKAELISIFKSQWQIVNSMKEE